MTRIARIAASTGLIAAITISSAAAALAADNGRGSAHQDQGRGQHPGRDMGGMRGGPLADLVAKGTITQAQADAVKAALQKSHDADEATKRADHEAAEQAVLDALVKDGTISRAQADTVANADRGGLRDLVDDGTLTKDQAMKIVIALRASHDANREAKQAEHQAERTAAIARLVKAGTITQAQADAIVAAMPAGPGMHLGRGGRGPGDHGDRDRGARRSSAPVA